MTTSEEGFYTVVITKSGCSDESEESFVGVITPSVTASASASPIEQGSSVTLSANGGNPGTADDANYTYFWTTTNEAGQVITDSPDSTTTYTVIATEQGCDATDQVTVVVVRIPDPPNIYTPPAGSGSGDGYNDTWILDGIETHPSASIKVFNRWGNVVYEGAGGDDYINNPFRGKAKNGDDLPVATYYYVIELNYKEIVITGAVSIVR